MNIGAELAEQIVLSPAELLAALADHTVLALATRRLEAGGEWAFDGSVSMAAWLRDNARMSHRTAHRLIHRGRFLDRFTAIAEAAVARVLSASLHRYRSPTPKRPATCGASAPTPSSTRTHHPPNPTAR